MELNDKQMTDYNRLKAYYLYRMFFLAFTDEDPEGIVWALRDKRMVNQAIREGATLFQIQPE